MIFLLFIYVCVGVKEGCLWWGRRGQYIGQSKTSGVIPQVLSGSLIGLCRLEWLSKKPTDRHLASSEVIS